MGNCFDSLSRVETPGHSGNNASSGAPTSKTISSSQDASYGSMDTSSGEITTSSTTGANLRDFTFGDLKTATRNFRADNVLGEGGFGRVFKGYIDEHTFLPSRAGQGMVVAVKKLNLEGFQGHREWLAEVHFLGAIHHQNLVKLIGFCAEDDHRLLVYEFMPRGSLENHLFRKGNTNLSLTWEIRMKIAVGAARGLAVLHDAERPVIYRDFKASNILLDSQYNAKLSDFGLAKDGPTGDNTHVSTRVMGTYGYAAPEYVATGHLTPKSDIYSFGVVLLEILTGRRAVDKNRPVGEQKLVDWAKPYLNDRRKVLRLVDQRLEGQYSLKGAQRAANVALRCLNPEAKNRPTMKEILATLEPLLNAGKAHSLEGRNRVQDNLNSTMTHPLLINGATKQGNGISPYQSPNIAGYVGRRQE